jgi:hypothetical protein
MAIAASCAGPARSGAGAPAAHRAPATAPGGSADPLAEKLRHCPVTVEGASTEIRDTTDGVELLVTAAVADAVARIRARARHLEAFTRGADTGVRHGAGRGGGWMRNCPVVTRDTLVTASDIERGVRIHVRPRDARAVEALRRDTRQRHAGLAAPGAD